MRRFLRIILLLAVFVGGYYVGRLPNSPDIFAWGADFYRRVDTATRDITAKSKAENATLAEATMSYLLSPGTDSNKLQDQ